jgi:hypothetical protein
MSEQLQLRRGNAAELATFTGAQGEAVYDTTNNRLVGNDGSTAGGFPAARLDEVQTISRQTVNNLNYTVTPTDRLVAFSAVATPRFVTLAASSQFPVGPHLTIVDESGSITAALTITIQPNGSDTINGVNAPITLGSPYGSVELENAGGGAWFIIAKQDNSTPSTPINDTSYTAKVSDRGIVMTGLSSARTITLPPSIGYPLGKIFSVVDGVGTCSPTISITVTPNGSDLINGSSVSYVMTSAYQFAQFINTLSGWSVASTSPQVAQLPSIGSLVFRARGIPGNTTGDTQIPISLPTGITVYQVDSVLIDNCSVAPASAARVGVYTAASQGGVALGAQQAINGITSGLANTNNNSLRLTLTNNMTTTVNAASIFINVGTANGSALTFDATVSIKIG